MKIIFTLILLVVGGLSFWLGRYIPFSQQMPIYDGLRDTSSIIFAVMGAWIALLYPSMLSKVFYNSTKNGNTLNPLHIRRLFSPLIYSTYILLIVISINFLIPLAKQIEVLFLYKNIFRGISFSVIAVLTCLQFWSLILTLIPGASVKDDLDEIKRRQDTLDRMGPGSK